MADKENRAGEADVHEYLSKQYGNSIADEILNIKKQQVNRERALSQLTSDMRSVLGRVVVIMDRISADEIAYYMQQKECKRLFELVKSDFEDEFTDDASKEFRKNRQSTVDYANQLFEETRKEIFEEKYEVIRELERSDRDDAEEIVDRIEEPFDNPAKAYLWNRLDGIKAEEGPFLRTNPYGPKQTSVEIPAINGDPDFIYKMFAVWMYRPEITTTLFQYEKKFQEFPLKWLTSLPVPAIRYLYDEFKNGTIHDEVIVQQVNQDGYLTDLRTAAEKLPPFTDRKTIVSEITANYCEGRYASATNLVLPQIEYLMWLYAAFVHQYSSDDILVNVNYSTFWEFNTESFDFALQNSTGTIDERPRVKNLVDNTEFGKYLNPAVVEYFTEEMFEERNPILHGSIAGYGTELNAARKVLFFRNLIDDLTKRLLQVGTEQVTIQE